MSCQARIAKGVPIGLPVYGYKKVDNGSKLWVPDPLAAEVVREIYHLALTGHGIVQIAEHLKKNQILTPSHYCLSKGDSRGGKTSSELYNWSPSSVDKILQRQEYCGDIVNQKTYSRSFKDKKRHANPVDKMSILRDVHEPIIERHLWEYIQQKRKNQKNHRKAGKQTLFSGFLRCGDCESNMHFHFNRTNPSIEYFNCSNYVGNRGACPDTHYVRVDFLELQVLRKLNNLIRFAKCNWNTFAEIVEQNSIADAKSQTAVLTEKHRNLQNRLDELKTLITKLYEDKTKGVVDDETFIILASEFKKERGQIQKQIQTDREMMQKSNSILQGLSYFKEAIERQESIKFLVRKHLENYVDYIKIYPAEKRGGEHIQKIVIHYQFIGVVAAKDMKV